MNNVFSSGKRLQLATIQFYFAAMLRAVSRLHKSMFAHCDLKESNFFLTDELYPILGEFGLVTSTRSTARCHLTIGSSGYMAPELLDEEVHLCDTDLTKADSFSLGVILRHMLARNMNLVTAGE